jgi:hypothetical protein
MYVVSFIDAGKLVQVSTPSATVAATLQGYLQHAQCRVFKQNKLIADIKQEALIIECQRRYGKAFIAGKVRSFGLSAH